MLHFLGGLGLQFGVLGVYGAEFRAVGLQGSGIQEACKQSLHALGPRPL